MDQTPAIDPRNADEIAAARAARQKFEADIAQACRAHDLYLAEYGSLAEAISATIHGEE